MGLLDGVRVIELGQYISAPYCAKVLGDLGATVLKVEPPAGDLARSCGPFPDDVPHREKGGLFLYLNTNKRGVTLNLLAAEGRAILLRLLESTDVMVENYPPDFLPSLGLDFTALAQANPHLILTSISPFGAKGPYRDWRATDLVLLHMGGYAMNLPTEVEDPDAEPPIRVGGHQAGFVAGVAAAIATLAALFQRRRTGRGGPIDLSEHEAVAAMLPNNIGRAAYGQGQHSRWTPQDQLRRTIAHVIPCKDGHLAFSPREEHQWAQWVELMGSPAWARDERFLTREGREAHVRELLELVGQWSRTQGKHELYQEAQARHIPCFPVNTAADLLANQQLWHRGFFVEVEHPVAGKLTHPGLLYHFSNASCGVERPAPLLGQHNREVLCGALGYSPQDLPRLCAAGVV